MKKILPAILFLGLCNLSIAIPAISQIKVGMTNTTVENILGNPDSYDTEEECDSYRYVYLQYFNKSQVPVENDLIVYFDVEGRVIGTAKINGEEYISQLPKK